MFHELLNRVAENISPYLIVFPILCGLLIIMIRSSVVNLFLNLLSSLFLLLGSVVVLINVKHNGDLIYNLGSFNSSIGIQLKISAFSTFFLFVLTFMHFLNTVLHNFQPDIVKKVDSTKVGLINIFIGGCVGMVITDDLFNLYVFLEIVSIVGYILTTNRWNKNSYISAFDYLMIGSVASGLILFGIGFAYANFGTLNISEIFQIVSGLSSYVDLMIESAIFFISGFLIKSGIWPFHHWYINLYRHSSPSTLSLFSYTSSNIAVIVFVKVVYMLYGMQFMTSTLVYLYNIIICISIVSIVYCGWKAITTKYMSEVIVYSSISQVGYMLIGFMSDNNIVITGALMQFFGNCLSKLLILRVYQKMVFSSQLNAIEVDAIGRFDFSGIRMLIVVLLLNMSGLPLSIGFISKIYMIIGFIGESKFHFFILIILSSLFGLVYTFRLIEGVIIGNKPGTHTDVKFYKINISWIEKITFYLVAIMIVILPFFKWFNGYIHSISKYILLM